MSEGSDALAKARGDVRDGIAVIEHFVQVLASRRVGTRALVGALPGVRTDCEPLLGALSTLERTLANELVPDVAGIEAVDELLAYAAARVEALRTALANFNHESTHARARLAIEAVVRPVAHDLGNVMRLVEMLGPKEGLDATTIDFVDALAATPRRSVRLPTTPVLAIIEGPTQELLVRNPRLVLDLLEFGVATVVAHGVESPRIRVEPSPSGFPRFVIDAAPLGTDRTRVGATQRTFDVADPRGVTPGGRRRSRRCTSGRYAANRGRRRREGHHCPVMRCRRFEGRLPSAAGGDNASKRPIGRIAAISIACPVQVSGRTCLGEQLEMSPDALRPLIEAAFRDRSLISDNAHEAAVLQTVDLLDQGAVRVASRGDDGTWTTHSWVKEAILL